MNKPQFYSIDADALDRMMIDDHAIWLCAITDIQSSDDGETFLKLEDRDDESLADLIGSSAGVGNLPLLMIALAERRRREILVRS